MTAIVTEPIDVVAIVGEKLYFSGPQPLYTLAKLVGFDANEEILLLFIDLLRDWEKDGGIHVRKSNKHDFVVVLTGKTRKRFKKTLEIKKLDHTYHSILAEYGLKESD
jgi:hypothetical protein